MQYKIQQMNLEDLYTALLLGGVEKSLDSNKYSVTLQKERLDILNFYLDRYGLHNSFLFNVHQVSHSESVVLEFETTLSVKRIFKEWYYNNEVVAISPMHLNLNVCLLWISLFGEKRKNFVRLMNEHISQDAKKTFATLFKEITGIELATNSMQFAIHDVKELILLTMRTKRPAYEVRSLADFVSEREFKKLQTILNERAFYMRGGLVCECY